MHTFLDSGRQINVDLGAIEMVHQSQVKDGGSMVLTRGGHGFHTESSPDEVLALIDKHKQGALAE